MDKLLDLVDKLFFDERYERKRRKAMGWFVGLAAVYYGCHVAVGLWR